MVFPRISVAQLHCRDILSMSFALQIDPPSRGYFNSTPEGKFCSCCGAEVQISFSFCSSCAEA